MKAFIVLVMNDNASSRSASFPEPADKELKSRIEEKEKRK
jgi:hypothetical protein